MNKQAKRSTVGGQGVLGGVMMRSPKKAALAVRKSDGDIAIKQWEVEQKKSWFARLPIVRGVINFVDMLFTGVGVLMDAAKMSEEGTEEFEPSKFEKFVAGKLGKKAEDVMMFFAVVIAVVLAILLFFMLPTFNQPAEGNHPKPACAQPGGWAHPHCHSHSVYAGMHADERY